MDWEGSARGANTFLARSARAFCPACDKPEAGGAPLDGAEAEYEVGFVVEPGVIPGMLMAFTL